MLSLKPLFPGLWQCGEQPHANSYSFYVKSHLMSQIYNFLISSWILNKLLFDTEIQSTSLVIMFRKQREIPEFSQLTASLVKYVLDDGSETRSFPWYSSHVQTNPVRKLYVSGCPCWLMDFITWSSVCHFVGKTGTLQKGHTLSAGSWFAVLTIQCHVKTW